MNIAICDDDKLIAELFCGKVREEAKESKISIYTSGVDLIKSNMTYDVVFFDIEMEIMDGFRVAEILNEKYPQCIFSFMTTRAELAVDGYDYQPFRCILKTAPKSVIKRKISETLNEYYRRNITLNIAYKRNYRTILVKDIFYIEISGHCMKIILDNDKVLCNKSLHEAEKELNKHGLVRCHRSFIVSLSWIREYTLTGIKMKNGVTIPIGRKYKKDFFEQYNNYMLVR